MEGRVKDEPTVMVRDPMSMMEATFTAAAHGMPLKTRSPDMCVSLIPLSITCHREANIHTITRFMHPSHLAQVAFSLKGF